MTVQETVAATVRLRLRFGATQKLTRSCALGTTKNPSRHCLPSKTTRILDPAQFSICDSHVVKNYAFSGGLIDQSPSSPMPHAGFGLSWQDDDHGDCGLCQRQVRNFVSIFRLRKTERPIGTVAATGTPAAQRPANH